MGKTSGQQRRPIRIPPKWGHRQRSGTNHKCSRCGKGPHSRQTCPARYTVCHTCQKKGHSQCFSRSVANELLNPKQTWVWTDCQDIALENMKRKLTKPVVLALHDLAAKTKICADASTYWLEPVLLQQQQDSQWKLLPTHPSQWVTLNVDTHK